jgi:murein endopeptidase
MMLGVALVATAALAPRLDRPAGAQSQPPTQSSEPVAPFVAESAPLADDGIRWRPSVPVGLPYDGELFLGVRLPAEGANFITWDPVRRTTPNRGWRRWAADGTIRILLRVLRQFRQANPDAPRIAVGDLSRPHGGDFGPQFGSIGHASHQNGLDLDLYYPRLDGREWRAKRPELADLDLAQDLVRRFVRAGAEYVFVGPNTGLRGPKRKVQAIDHHDDHMHVRFPRRLVAPGR